LKGSGKGLQNFYDFKSEREKKLIRSVHDLRTGEGKELSKIGVPRQGFPGLLCARREGKKSRGGAKFGGGGGNYTLPLFNEKNDSSINRGELGNRIEVIGGKNFEERENH